MNVNFVNIIDKKHIEVDTWERGAGKTLACGTDSCASVIISHRLGKVDNILKYLSYIRRYCFIRIKDFMV